jgi:hypothetical protein
VRGHFHLLIALFTLVCPISAQDPAEFFESRVRPVLSKNCYACHTNSKLGGLQLDSREHLLKGGNSGPAIVPGQPDSSLLVQAVRRTHERLKMPPQGKLSDEEITSLAAWVKMGAVWPSSPAAPKSPAYVITPEQRAFWSFQPVRKPPIPAVRDPRWAKSDIDRFILAKLESEGLKPVRPADRRALIRRVTFDVTGLPPTPDEGDAFVADRSPDAFAKVVDRLLASPHYGERQARLWLDLARYADGNLGASKDTPYPNAYRYRDWVIRAFNQDMPYDLFVKAQLAADLLPNNKELLPALGFHALGGRADDSLDVTTRGILGLTVACAQCHDHKYDPIPTQDYYSLLGVFKSSEIHEIPLAPDSAVAAYKELEKKIEDKKYEVDEFLRKSNVELSEMLVRKTARYMVAGFTKEPGDLDPQILERWTKYLAAEKDYPYLKAWAMVDSLEKARKVADEFQTFVIGVFEEKKAKDDRNYVAMGGSKGVRDERTRQYTNLESLDIIKYYLWRDLASEPYKKDFLDFKGGVYYFGDKEIGRFLSAEAKDYYEGLKAELAALKKSLPEQYPFLHAVRDSSKPADVRVAIRGEAANLGEAAPRRNLRILCNGEPARFTKGSGRLEFAESIASVGNPLTARVIVNRIWKMHFGQGIVRTPSNFGQLGERPTHPELLDYLATRLVDSRWSLKALHREILLSAAYQLSVDNSDASYAKDPDNRLLSHANLRQRLDAEELRDSLLAAADKLDLTMYGPPSPLIDTNYRRAIYGYVGRTKPDNALALFDFPNPNNMSEQRTVTVGPLQRLYFLNNDFVTQMATALADRLDGDTDERKIGQAYRLLFGRLPVKSETGLGLDFLRRSGGAWAQYAQALLSSSEFSSVN